MMQSGNRAFSVCAIFLAGGLFFSPGLRAQASGASSAGSGQPQTQAASAGGSETDQLRQQLADQQKQIQALQLALQKQQELLEKLAPKAGAATGNPASPAGRAVPPRTGAASTTLGSSLPESAFSPQHRDRAALDANASPPAIVSDATSASYDSSRQMNPAVPNSPIAPIRLRIGRATLTPLGFVDATEFWRSKNLGSGIGAAFGSLPFSNTTAGRLTENRLSIQNSRIGLMMDSQSGASKVRGYLETDFLGAQPANAFVTSNSDSLRVRLYWVDIQRGKFEFLGGQSWSLLTPGRIGISPMPSDLFYTQDFDTNYQVGLTWARQLQFRFTYHATPNVTAALSLENAEQYTGGAVTFPTSFSTSQVNT
ncbi:MAG: hypothetical protein ACRD10_07435, partial [Terriglobia bacterium]